MDNDDDTLVDIEDVALVSEEIVVLIKRVVESRCKSSASELV